MRSFPLILILLCVVLSCKKQETVTQSSAALPNFQGGGCNIGKWPALPVSLKMSTEFTSDYIPADLVGGLNPLEQMAKAWNNAVTPTILITTPFPTTTANYSTLGEFKDGELGIYKSHTWFSGVSSNALAITQFFGRVQSDASLGTYIELTHADIIFNYRDFNGQLLFNAGPFDYDVPTVLLHEMGHFLGLCHESAQPSIMAPYYNSNQRSLRDWDFRKIRGLYLNNQNITALGSKPQVNALSAAPGTEIKGIVELMSNGHCRHYINGKMVYEHTSNVYRVPAPKRYQNLPLK